MHKIMWQALKTELFVIVFFFSIFIIKVDVIVHIKMHSMYSFIMYHHIYDLYSLIMDL